MARNLYGCTSADFTLTESGRVVAGATATVWTARTGGTQITDLTDLDGDPITSVTSDADGGIRFYGVDGDKDTYWLDTGTGARIAVRPADLTGEIGPTPDLTIGTVTTGTAAATITGTDASPVLNLTLPSSGANGVNTAAIQDGAVTSAKIADGTITTSDVAAGTFAAFQAVGNLLSTNQASIESSAPSFGTNRCTISRSSDFALSGTYSLKVIGNASGTASVRIPSTGTNATPVVAGETYTAAAWLYSASNTDAVRATLQWWDAAGSALTSADGAYVALSASWTERRVIATAPSGAAFATMYITWASAASETFYIDNIGIWKGSGGRYSLPGSPIVAQAPGDGTVTAASIAASAVGTTAVADGAVTPAKQSTPAQSHPTWITTFQSGHGWTKSSGTAISDDTTTYKTGSQSLLINTAAADKSGLGLDLTGRDLIVDLRVSGTPGTGTTVTVFAGNSGLTAHRKWVVYNEATSSRQFNGDQWIRLRLAWAGGELTGSPSQSAVDTLRIAVAGGTGQANVQAIGYAPTVAANRRGVVSFTFDDGWSTQLRGANVLGSRGITATAYLIPQELGNAGYLTTAEARTLRTDYGWDLQAHNTYGYPGQTESDLRTLLSDTVDLFASMGIGPRPRHVAYPGGQNDALSSRVVGEFFDTARTVDIQRGEPLPVAAPLHLRCASGIGEAAGGISVAATQSHIDRAIATRGWAILAFHKITPGAATDTMECSEAGLATIADYAISAGAEILTVSECWDRYGRR